MGDVQQALGFAAVGNPGFHPLIDGIFDCIISADAEAAETFLRSVDSACVFHNVSSRLADGEEFGFGAEIGISTDKLHARGPMGLRELTSYQYRVSGDGVIK